MRITTVDGEPAAVALAVPNVNEVLRDLDGKLFPFGVPKLLWRLKVTGLKSARLIILGVRKKFRNVKKYAALSTYLYVKMNQAGAVAGYTHGELSYTMEDNHPINLAIKFIGGERYKTYRLYTKPL
jgi:hypothetical protein